MQDWILPACVMKELHEWHQIGMRKRKALAKMAHDEKVFKLKVKEIKAVSAKIDDELQRILHDMHKR